MDYATVDVTYYVLMLMLASNKCLFITGCLQLLEILKIWNLKLLLEILEISWNLVDAPANFIN